MNEAEMISSSPMKRGSWKSRPEANSERDDEVETVHQLDSKVLEEANAG